MNEWASQLEKVGEKQSPANSNKGKGPRPYDSGAPAHLLHEAVVPRDGPVNVAPAFPSGGAGFVQHFAVEGSERTQEVIALLLHVARHDLLPATKLTDCLVKPSRWYVHGPAPVEWIKSKRGAAEVDAVCRSAETNCLKTQFERVDKISVSRGEKRDRLDHSSGPVISPRRSAQ